MSAARWVRFAVAGVGATAAAVTAGVAVERRVVRSRRAGAPGADVLGGLVGDVRTVRTEDGVLLHAEVDEIAPYASAKRPSTEPTLVFVHGYALSAECWFFQREHFRGKHRMVFYDQRSHGRSGKSDNEHATIDQLGDDLARVIDDLVPDGPVVLVGHSMGGMTVMAFAQRHPEMYDERVVGTALISTAAGGLKPQNLLSRLLPDAVSGQVTQRLVAGLALAPGLVDRVRRRGSNVGYLVADQFAFGDQVPEAYVEFLDNMLAATSFEVLAQFFPTFGTLDKFTVLEAMSGVPTWVVTGTKDLITPVSHSRTIASMMPGSRLVECPGAGHMVILERKDKVNAALADLFVAAGGRQPERRTRVS